MGTGMDKATAMLMKNELDGLHDQIRQWKAKYDALKASHAKLMDVLETIVMSCQDCGFFATEECEHQKECQNNMAKQALAEAEL